MDTIPAILDQKNAKGVAEVMKLLEPRDFVRLTQTCKTMKNFNTEGINIVHNNLCVEVSSSPRRTVFAMRKEEADGIKQYDNYWPPDYEGNDGGFFSTRENRRKLQKYPFVFEFAHLDLNGQITTEALTTIRSFLSEFPVKKIYKISTYGVEDWNGFVQLVKDFHPRSVCIDGGGSNDFIPREAATYFLQNKEIDFSSHFLVADDLILASPRRNLSLCNSPISKETYEALVSRFAHSTEEVGWYLGGSKFHFDPSTLFKVLPFDHKGSVSNNRPIVFFKENEPNCFYILRKDGKLVDCSNNYTCLACFTMVMPSEYPPCLQSKA